MRDFWTAFWLFWLAMLVIGDPIASWLGGKDHVGDRFTDTHLLVSIIPYWLRIVVIIWLAVHFLVQHIRS